MELMAENLQEIAQNQQRRGRGRPKLIDERWIASRGIRGATAAEILHWADEMRQWKRLFASKDDMLVLRALMYLTDRRDGKPAQQINVTSQSVTLNMADLERAREIVRELRGDGASPNLGLPASGGASAGASAGRGPKRTDSAGDSNSAGASSDTTSIMSGGSEGAI